MFTEDFKVLNEEDYSLSFLKYTYDLVNSENWTSSEDLYAKIFKKGRNITKKYGRKSPLIFVILKVLKIVRVECARVLSGNPELAEQATNLLFAESEAAVRPVPRQQLQEFLAEAVQELQVEVEEASNALADSAARQIRDGDSVITYGYSDLVLATLRVAVENKRTFSVTVLSSAPPTEAALMASRLSQLGVSVLLAPERASYALLATATKVLLEAVSAHTDGALLCTAGLQRLCLDAKARAVPVLICVPSCRLAPQLSAAADTAELAEVSAALRDGSAPWAVYRHDVVPAGLATALLTNVGPLHTSQLMAIARDSFCADDVRDFLAVV